MTSIWGMEWTTDSTQCFTECRTWRRRSFPKHVTRRISRRSSWPKWWPKWFKSFFCRDRWDSQDGWTAWTSWNLEPVWFQDLILSQGDKCAFLLFGDSFALFQLCLIHWSKLFDFPINFAFILIITRSSSRRLALPLGLDMLRIFLLSSQEEACFNYSGRDSLTASDSLSEFIHFMMTSLGWLHMIKTFYDIVSVVHCCPVFERHGLRLRCLPCAISSFMACGTKSWTKFPISLSRDLWRVRSGRLVWRCLK